ncbi:Uncharacterised protein [Campylobacter geochelonis]|nr:Uncharacterised protein [Campylobacter geochelonis]CZE51406.1 Uncharacterised protein [Campylobacter geochelonis]
MNKNLYTISIDKILLVDYSRYCLIKYIIFLKTISIYKDIK